MYSDGGGKVRAALNPIYGADKVARGLLGNLRKLPPTAVSRLVRVNGHLGIMSYLDGVPLAVLSLAVVDDHI
jgi:hypothetical protein